jgi:hypothetical protein
MLDQPGEWPINYTGCGPQGIAGPCAVLGRLSDEDRSMVEERAVDYLWNFTNRVFGVTEVVVRPCRTGVSAVSDTFWGRGPFPMSGTSSGGGATGWYPALIGSSWFNIGCGSCLSGVCSCGPGGTFSLSLPGPVVEVTEVRIDGEVLPERAYRLEHGRFLVRRDGEGWPQAQDLTKSASQPGTFEVTYRRGLEVPAGGRYAAGRLAVEFAKSFMGDSSCALPRRMQTITRQETTITLMNDFRELEGGTGIWEIDNWIEQVVRPKSYASVRSVDVSPRIGARRGR